MRVTIATFLLLAVSLPAVAQSRTTLDPEQTRILALETAWNRAEEQKDSKALDGLLASKLLYIDYDGKLMNKAQFLASVKAPSLHPEQIVNEPMTDGKSYLRRGRFIDAWINQDGTWRCVTSQSTLISR